MRKIKKSRQDIILDIIIYTILIVIGLVTLYPMWYVVAASFTTTTELFSANGLFLWPKEFTATAYTMVFKDPLVLSGFVNILKIMLISLPINIVMTMLCGYFMASKGMKFKQPIILFILFTMYFSGGMIPRYLLINNTLGLGNSIWVLILPHLVTTYNLVVMRTGFEAIPDSLEESAQIDGASHFTILFRIIIPVALPSMAVVILFYAVSYWNAWFDACIFINERDKFPLQVILREILLQNSTESMSGGEGGDKAAIAESIRYATIMVATVPVLVIYPFVQKYFVKGAMVGAVKG